MYVSVSVSVCAQNAKAEARRVSQEREDLWQQLKEKGAALEVAADKARQRQDVRGTGPQGGRRGWAHRPLCTKPYPLP